MRVRRAVAADADPFAALYLRARRAAVPAIPAVVHVESEVREWVRTVVLADRETWVAEQGRVLLALLVLDDAGIDQLYTDPACTGRGIGTTLVRLAQRRRPGGLSLWTFASNTDAHRFYERHGFVAVEHTDGRRNEEHAPDVRFEWGIT